MNFLKILLLIFLLGCPGSNFYRPLPKWEAKFFSQARRDIFPRDVLNNRSKYTNTLVVWTGIIKEIKIDQEADSKVHRFTIEHHYFDWIEDHGVQRERYFLSARGEGNFALAWGEYEPDDAKFLKQFSVGDMIVAYGYPSMFKGDLIGFYPVQNIRSIKPEWYRTDVLDYGRPGEKTKILKTVY